MSRTGPGEGLSTLASDSGMWVWNASPLWPPKMSLLIRFPSIASHGFLSFSPLFTCTVYLSERGSCVIGELSFPPLFFICLLIFVLLEKNYMVNALVSSPSPANGDWSPTSLGVQVPSTFGESVSEDTQAAPRQLVRPHYPVEPGRRLRSDS